MRIELHLTAIQLLAILTALGCADEETTPAASPSRPPHVVNEQTAHDNAQVDSPVLLETVTHFRTTDTLPELDVRRLLLLGDRLYAGGASSVMVLDGESFSPLGPSGANPIVGMAARADGAIAIARTDRVLVMLPEGQPVDEWEAGSYEVRCVAAHGDDVYVGTTEGLAQIDESGVVVVGAAGIAVRDIAVIDGVLQLATAQGLLRYDATAGTELPALTAPAHLPDNDVRAVRVSLEGDRVVVGTALGIALLDASGNPVDQRVAGIGALPMDDVSAVAAAGDVTFVGHSIGATAWSDEHKDYYHTNRWILADRVNDVAIESDGTRWVATQNGISRIAFEQQTLAERAEINEAKNASHWRMDGFVADSAYWDDEWDRTGKISHHDHDNDGLWTEMQVAGWCFAYAATGEERFYENGRKAMDVMQLQFDVPAVTFEAAGKETGFITRSLVRSDEGELFEDKKAQSNWHLQEHDGATYYWKDDTSSDEYAGHFFGIPVFYDLCAKTEAEREAIRVRVHRAMSYIVDHGYLLIDLDGEPTTHGHWADLADAVDGLNACLVEGGKDCFESYGGGGWLNSIEILGMLLASWHITGDDRFYDEYERLAITERYGEMVPVREWTATVTTRKIANHSDHELATLAYYTLLRYEPHADRRATWIQSIRDFYGYEKDERNPFQIAVMASAMPDANIADAVKTLLEMPLDWRTWRYDNSHRRDNELDVLDRHGHEQFKHMYPYDEIRTMKWNGNPYNVSGGSDGREEQAPWPYLMPYWMMRYYGAIR